MMKDGLIAFEEKTGKNLAKKNEFYEWQGKVWETDCGDGMPLVDEDVIYFNGLEGIYAFKSVR